MNRGFALPGKNRQGRPRGGPLLFLLPGFIGFAIFYLWPFCVSLGYAFLTKPVNGAFAGLRNFIELLGNKAYLTGLANTLKFIGISVPLNMGLSLGIAMLISKTGRRRDLYSLLFLIPLVIPSGSMVSFWKALFSYDGALNGMLDAAGFARVNWLDSGLAMFVMVLIFVWKNLGYNMTLYLAGLSNVPVEYYEAAWVDGAKPWNAFLRITLPMLAPTSVLALIMSIVNSFKVFKEIYLIMGSYPHESVYTLQHFMNNMFSSLNYPRLTAATTVMTLFITLFTQLLLRLERKASA